MSNNGVMGQGGFQPGVQPPMGERQPMGGGQYAPLQPGQAPPPMNVAPVPPAQPTQAASAQQAPQGPAPWMQQQTQPAYPAVEDDTMRRTLLSGCQAVALGHAQIGEVVRYFSGWTEDNLRAFAADHGYTLPGAAAPVQQPSTQQQPQPQQAAPEPTQAAPQPTATPTSAEEPPKKLRSRLNKKEDLPKIEALMREGVTDPDAIGRQIGLKGSSVKKQMPKIEEKLKQEQAQTTIGGYIAPEQTALDPAQVVPGALFEGSAAAPPEELVSVVKMKGHDLRWDTMRGRWEVVLPKSPAPAAAATTSVPVEAAAPKDVARAGYVLMQVRHLAEQAGCTYGEIASAAELLDSVEG